MDDIQQKLNQIDRQLKGEGFHSEIINSTPLLFPTAGFILGIVVQNAFAMAVWLWLTLLFIFAGLAVTDYVYYHKKSYRSALVRLMYWSLLCSLSFGAIRIAIFYQPAPNDIRGLVSEEKTIATIKGWVLTQPRPSGSQEWYLGKFTPKAAGSGFYLDANEIQTTTGWSKISGRVRVQVSEQVVDLKEGDYIKIYCWLERFESTGNPGQFDFTEYLKRRNVYLAASVKSRISIEVIEKGNLSLFRKIQVFFTDKAVGGLLNDFDVNNPGSGLLEALLLGLRGNIESKTNTAFQKTGLLHLISLSGMHFAIFVGTVWWLCRLIGLTKRPAAIACLFALAIFLLIVPPQAPTLRAAVICLVFCLAALFQKHGNSINTLCISSFVLLLFTPTGLFEPDWQLSFTAVAGILFFTKNIQNFLVTRLLTLLNKEKIRYGKLINSSLEVLAVGIAAWFGSAGILLYHFYTIVPMTIFWTVIASPFVSITLVLGYFKIVFSFLLPTAGIVLGTILNSVCNLLVKIVEYIADWNISGILVGKVNIFIIILYYLIIILSVYFYPRKPLLKKILIVILSLIVAGWIGEVKWQRSYRNHLSMSVLAVGHGQAVLLQFPGKNILFDCGSLTITDPGRKVCVPFLNYNGVGRLDAIVISHNDIDHINGIPEIVENCNVRSIYAGEAFFKDSRETVKLLNSFLDKNEFKVQRLENKLATNKKSNIKIIWGTEGDDINTLASNDQSIVALIEFAGKKILLCSDIEKYAQQQILRKYPNIKADIVVVPHHNSKVTISPQFLKQLEAKFLIASCGKGKLPNMINTENINLISTAQGLPITVVINNNGNITLNKLK